MIEIGVTLNQRFLLEKELGRGGMGAVYSATDQVLQRQVAIKVLKEQSGEEVGKRLRLEAQIAARLLHDNVVRIYDFGQAESAYFLVMEQVDGTSYSKRWRHVPLTQRLRILAQIAEALDYAHHQGVVHRDIKPANVLVTSSNVPKLSDFGLSMVGEQGEQSAIVRGTPHYMSPEQTRGSRLDYRTDLYSLGVMIYESSTGTLPFTGTSLSIMTQHSSARPDPPRVRNSAVSEELESLILALLTKRPEERPGSGSVVAQALSEEIERIQERDQGADHGHGGAPEPDLDCQPGGAFANRADQVKHRVGSRASLGLRSAAAVDRGPARRRRRHRGGHRRFDPRFLSLGRRRPGSPRLGRQHRRRHRDDPFATGPADVRGCPGRADRPLPG